MKKKLHYFDYVAPLKPIITLVDFMSNWTFKRCPWTHKNIRSPKKKEFYINVYYLKKDMKQINNKYMIQLTPGDVFLIKITSRLSDRTTHSIKCTNLAQDFKNGEVANLALNARLSSSNAVE